MEYKVVYSGYTYVEADSKESAIEKACEHLYELHIDVYPNDFKEGEDNGSND